LRILRTTGRCRVACGEARLMPSKANMEIEKTSRIAEKSIPANRSHILFRNIFGKKAYILKKSPITISLKPKIAVLMDEGNMLWNRFIGFIIDRNPDPVVRCIAVRLRC